MTDKFAFFPVHTVAQAIAVPSMAKEGKTLEITPQPIHARGMYRKLWLIRHAKSDWSRAGLSDFARPLNARGLRDAPMMGARLKKAGMHPDAFISSPAMRARTTAALMAEALAFPPDEIQMLESLYLASPHTMLEAIGQIPDSVENLALVAHNPGISELAAMLGCTAGPLPTCAVAVFSGDIENWGQARHLEPLAFDYPKRAQTPTDDSLS